MRSTQTIFTLVNKLKLPSLKEWLREVEKQEKKDVKKLGKVSLFF